MSNLVQPPLGYYPEPIHNIQRLVLVVIEELKEYGVTTAKYRWLEMVATEFYRTVLRGFNMPSLVSEKMTINYGVRNWAFPPDYIQFTKIAYNVNGRLVTLGYFEEMNIADAPQSCPGSLEDVPLSNGGFWLAPYWGSNLNLYSSGGGFARNYYRVVNNQYIQFSQDLPPGEAIVEYLSSGKAVNGLTLIPIAYEHSFKNYLKWQFCLLNLKYIKLAPTFRELYDGAIWNSNALMGKPIEAFLDEMYKVSGFKIR